MTNNSPFFESIPTESAIMQHWAACDAAPIVSVLCLTYNQRQYIEDTIRSLLIQISSHPFEIIINDDCSTDGTQDFLRSVQSLFPNIIKLNLQVVNQHSLGKKNLPSVIALARGKYYAFCEGDDYWTSPDKLQTQIDVMELHPAVPLSFHACQTLVRGSSNSPDYYPPGRNQFYSADAFLIYGGNLSPSAACIYRADYFKSLPDWIYEVSVLDVFLETIAAERACASGEQGVLYIDKVMSAYRVLAQGSWNAMPVNKVKEEHSKYIDSMQRLNKFLDFKYDELIQAAIERRPSFDAHRCLMNMDGPAVRDFARGNINLSKPGLRTLLFYCLSYSPKAYRAVRQLLGKAVI
mgnify:CR=1 FL=1